MMPTWKVYDAWWDEFEIPMFIIPSDTFIIPTGAIKIPTGTIKIPMTPYQNTN